MADIERIAFFGTPSFALPALDALVAAERSPVLVVTQPARPAGRGRHVVEPPVALRARQLGLEIVQPTRVRDADFLEVIRRSRPDLSVVVAFGQIFPAALLELPRLGSLNLHASLLPRWRGAAPIAAAIEAGDAATGVSVQRMVAALDAGPVLGRVETAIGPRETAGELARRLAALGAELLVRTIDALEAGKLREEPQDESTATHARSWRARRNSISSARRQSSSVWCAPACRRQDRICAWREGDLRVLEARAHPGGERDAPPGVFLGVGMRRARSPRGAASVLELVQVQRPGRAPVSGRDFANGARLVAGERLCDARRVE